LLNTILISFVVLTLIEYSFEKYLAHLNRTHYLASENQRQAMAVLGIKDEEFQRALSYTEDKYKFGRLSSWLNITLFLAFLVVGGFGIVESWAGSIAGLVTPDSETVKGLIFFLILGVISSIYSIPFNYYQTFVIEERHGFNRQTRIGFALDLLKGGLIALVLGGILLYVILRLMSESGPYWWVWAWVAVSSFSVLTAWLYPTLLAPLFNKFSPLQDGELRQEIFKLAERINFGTDGILVMDASKRSSHGNAYFTGLFGKKRIVLFDTLIEAMNVKEIVAVLAHELGHFKLNHVRSSIIRGILLTGLTFYLLSLCLPLEPFYLAFGFAGISAYGALTVFSLWMGIIDFLLQPLQTYLSRRNEFAADHFALRHIDNRFDLGHALLKLREKSHALPICHPLYSTFYYSHPPMLERLKAMGFGGAAQS
jgi:STE24 endopeptidase